MDLFSCFGSTLTMSMDVCIYRCYFTEDIGFITGMSKGWHGAQLWDIGMFFFWGLFFLAHQVTMILRKSGMSSHCVQRSLDDFQIDFI